MNEYWKECVREALSDAGISATDEQIKIVADVVEGAHETFHDYCEVKHNPVLEELKNTRIALEKEKAKTVCTFCQGTGRYDPQDGFGPQSCYKCGGNGMILSRGAADCAEAIVRQRWEYKS